MKTTSVPRDPILARAVDRKGVENAAREVLQQLDRVGWPIVMNASVERLRSALDRAAGARVADRARGETP